MGTAFFNSLQVMKKNYFVPAIEMVTFEAERGFQQSQQKPSDWDDM